MREQLKLLEELQRHDARLQELESVLQSLPQKLAAAEVAISDMEKLLQQESAELTDNENFRRDQEAGHKEVESQISKTKAKLTQVRNLKESSAVQREMESAKKQLDTREEEVGKLSQAMEDLRKRIVEHEAKLVQDRKDLAEQQAATKRSMAEIEAQVSDERVAREQAAKRLRPDTLKKYGTIRMKRGLAVVPVKDGTCRGCNMNIPPQLYNILQRGTTLELCPNCNRIIYWSKLLEEPGKEKETAGSAAS